MQFNGTHVSVGLAGSAYAFSLHNDRHHETVHNNVPAEGNGQALESAANSQATKTEKVFPKFVNGLDSYRSIAARKRGQVAGRTPLPGTQTPVNDQQNTNGELPSPRNGQTPRYNSGLSPNLHPYLIHSAKSVSALSNREGNEDRMRLSWVLSPAPSPEEVDVANILLGMRNPNVVSPTPAREEEADAANVLLAIRNPDVVAPTPDREKEAMSLSSLGAKERFNLPRPIPSFAVERLNITLPSIDNTSVTASKINNVSNSDPPTPSPSQGAASPASSQGDDVQAIYYRLGLRRGYFPQPITPPGCAPVEESRIRAPVHSQQIPSWNYLMYTFLTVAPKYSYNTSDMIDAIMDWVPKIVKSKVGRYYTKRHAESSSSRNPEVFVKVEKFDSRLRRQGEDVRTIGKKEENGKKRKGKRTHQDNKDDEEPDEPQPPKKKRATKKPATQKSKKGCKSKGSELHQAVSLSACGSTTLADSRISS